MSIRDVSLKEVVAPAIVSFHKPSCPFCVKFKPVFDQVPQEAARRGWAVNVYRVNMAEHPVTGVTGVPTTRLIREGKPDVDVVGAKSLDALMQELGGAMLQGGDGGCLAGGRRTGGKAGGKRRRLSDLSDLETFVARAPRSPKRKSPKRGSPKRGSPKRKSPKRKSPKRKSPGRPPRR